MIEAVNISKSFGGEKVLDSLSFTVPDTGIFGIFGPSGSGKTTLLRIIAGLEKADAGEIRGTQGKKIAMMFQEDRLLKNCTALRNTELVSCREEALRRLEQTGLGKDVDKYPQEMSGGMQRRVALARALAYGGDVLILDEPFKGIEQELKEKIKAVIKEISLSVPVILVTHDEDEKSMADKFLLL